MHTRDEAQQFQAEESAAELVGNNTQQEGEKQSQTRFAADGNVPPVFDGTQLAMLSPSERGYGKGPGTTAGKEATDKEVDKEVADKDTKDTESDDLSAEGRLMERIAKQHGRAIEEASRRYNVPESDILAVITHESAGIATANAGASQKDRGAHAASGLMQVTEATWKHTLSNHTELSKYSFHAYRYNPTINILVGTAALADKREALENLGVDASGPHGTQLITMAFNAGEGIVSDAYHRAVEAGSRNPAEDCLKEQFLKPAIAKYPSVYSYYLTGGGKKRNPQRSRERAIELKYLEISKYPDKVEMLIVEANEHDMVEEDLDLPLENKQQVAQTETDETEQRA